MDLNREIVAALSAAFAPDEVEFLPRGYFNGKARALAYIDARDVMRRLDAVVGPANWSFDFDVLEVGCRGSGVGGRGGAAAPRSGSGSSDTRHPTPDTLTVMVRGRLTVCGVTKCDAGEAGGEDEPLKSAVSDALKRAAVHFGIGRYLYYLPKLWCAFDRERKQFTDPPRLDRAAVERALAICGVGTSGGTNRRDAESTEKKNLSQGTPSPSADSASPRLTPESGGDRRAVALPEKVAEKVRPASEIPAPARGQQRRPAARPAPQAQPQTGMTCTQPECGRPLTRGQHDVSVQAYGQPLCPACQKQHARSAA